MRVLSTFGMFLLLALLWLRVTAQSTWTIWLYAPDEGRLLQMDAEGAVLDQLELPAPPGFSLPQEVIIAPDGRLGAYIRHNERSNAQEIIVLHLADEAVRARVALPQLATPYNASDQLRLFRGSFSDGSDELIYVESIGGRGWAIRVLDLQSGEVAFSLAYGDDITTPYPPLHAGIIPHIQSVRGDAVTFTMLEGGVPVQHNYTWFYLSHAMIETVAAPTGKGDTLLQTGEMVHPLPDWRFPADNQNVVLRYRQRNSLHVYTPDDSGRFPFFVNANLDFRQLWFVQGGERILAEAYFDSLNSWWVLLERSGQEIERMPVGGYDVTSAPDGFLYLTQVRDKTALLHVDTTNDPDQARTIWVDDGIWMLLWADDTHRNTFASWSRLAEPYSDPAYASAGATPTLLPTPLPVLQAGMPAQVQTLEDDYLNMRDAPSLDSNVLALLESGVSIVLLDGPIQADGYIWWQIRTGNREGWVVEALPDVQAVIPPRPTAQATRTNQSD